MKKLIFPILVLSIGLTACSKDKIERQAHDDNEMMTSMHAMMDQMQAVNPTNDPDIDFATMMIIHHQGAINMANIELDKGSNDEMRAMALETKTAQQQEIEHLQTILAGLTADQTDTVFAMEQMKTMHKIGTMADTQFLTGKTDSDFAKLMMIHHQGGIDNASSYLHHGSNEELKAMATMMVEMQTQEIIELGDWLIANDN
jgi:uncharacterized protein (DUF305 family)